jgi:ABC-type sugar transport system ATPase subunit
MVAIRLEGIRKAYGSVEVLKGIDLDIRHGEFIVFVGPSGCGKSTLLRVMAGLEAVGEGELYFDGKRFTNVPPAKRGVAMVFQSYALYPHMTVAENMTMSLRLAGVPRAERMRKAAEVAELLQLTPFLDRKPAALSGGQRQRVAIGRALVRRPDVFLFDEPLSNLDAALRVETRVGIARLHHTLDNTMIYVTHDQVEAMTMADRIVILDQGSIAQVGSPMELYDRPANAFVAGFIGSPRMNFLRVAETGRAAGKLSLRTETGEAIDVAAAPVSEARAATLGLRPEHLVLSADGPIPGKVLAIELLGNETLIHVENSASTMVVKAGRDNGVDIGETVRLSFDPRHAHLFAADATSILSREAATSRRN